MSNITLRDVLDEKNRLNQPVHLCVEKHYQRVPTLTLCPWQEGIWLLPWPRLEFIRFVDEDSLERAELFFSHHRVTAVGENLRQILEWCRDSQVLCLRSMPAAHRASLRPTDPFISQLEVQALADLKNPSVGEVPF